MKKGFLPAWGFDLNLERMGRNSPGRGEGGRRPQVVSSGRGQAGSFMCAHGAVTLEPLAGIHLAEQVQHQALCNSPGASTGCITEEFVRIS